MWKKIKESKTFYVVLSILLSVLIWSYVVGEVNPTHEQTITGIPVEFQGEDLLESRNLLITEGNEQTVSLRFRTDRDTASKLDRESVSLVVSVSNITEPGRYRLYADIIYPSNISRSNISIENDESRYIEFTVAPLASKEIDVRPKFTGSVAEGYQGGEFTVTPDKVVIRGKEEDIRQVAYAKVVLGQQDMEATFEGELPLVFMNENGEELTGLDIRCDETSVYVIYPVVVVKEIPLSVSFLPGGGATAANVDPESFRIDPASISVSGPASVLANLTELIIGEVDLSIVTNTPNYEITFPIRLSDNITNESGITEATVTLTITGLSTREFTDVDNIDLVNIPEGYHAELLTLSKSVLIRGPQEELDEIFQGQIRIEADLSQLDGSGGGRQTVSATVHVDGGGSSVGAVGRYTVVVNLIRG